MIDLVFPLTLDGSGSFASTEDPKKVWRGRVLNVLSTFEGTRIMRPHYGTRSVDLAFETTDYAQGMARAVIARAMESLPEVRVVSVTTTTGTTWTSDGIEVSIIYESPSGQDQLSIPMSSEAVSKYFSGYVSFENLAIGDN